MRAGRGGEEGQEGKIRKIRKAGRQRRQRRQGRHGRHGRQGRYGRQEGREGRKVGRKAGQTKRARKTGRAQECQHNRKDHSHLSLKSNSLMAMPKAWQRLRGAPNSRAKVLSSILPKTTALGAFSSSSRMQLSSMRMKFLIEACLTLPPKLRAYDLSLSFQRGDLFLSLTTFEPPKSPRDSSSANLNMSKSSMLATLGRTTLSLRGPFMPRKLLSYSTQPMLTRNLERSQSLLGCMPLSQSWYTDPAALPRSLPRQAGLFFSISLVRLMQQLHPMHPRWFSQNSSGRWSSPMAWQHSLNPLWYRLKYTNECWLGCSGLQIA